jgi:hypothetical protein
MPIRFACPTCGNQLMAATQCVAKEVRCRNCETIVPIPTATPVQNAPASPIDAAIHSKSAAREVHPNPFQSPEVGGAAASSGAERTIRDGVVLTNVVPQTVEFGDVFRSAWHLAWEHFDCILTMSVPALVALALSHSSSFAIDYSLGVGALIYDEVEQSNPEYDGNIWNVVILAGAILAKCVVVWLSLGLVRYGQGFVRFRPEPWRCIYWGRRPFFRGCALFLLYTLLDLFVILPLAFVHTPILIAMALVFTTVTAVLAGLSLSQSVQLIVEKDVSLVDAVRISRRIMATNKGSLFAVLVAGWFGPTLLLLIPVIAGIAMEFVPLVRLFILISIAAYVLWMMVAMPFIVTLLSVFYFQASGRSC